MKIRPLFNEYFDEVTHLIEDWGISDIAITFEKETVLYLLDLQTKGSFLDDESPERCALQICALVMEAKKRRDAFLRNNPQDLVTELRKILGVGLQNSLEDMATDPDKFH